jgi:hypothetical protein
MCTDNPEFDVLELSNCERELKWVALISKIYMYVYLLDYKYLRPIFQT